MEPNVYIVVVNWNNWRDTNECLASLRALAYSNFTVLLVDNGSTDGSACEIRKAYPKVMVIETGKNLGFAGGNNAGIRKALEHGAQYIWLLNNDTKVAPDSLRALVRMGEENPRIGVVGSVIYHMAEPERLQAWGGGRVNFWLGRSRHFIRPVADRKLEFITGASLFVRKQVLESVGLLDEQFFMYWEDSDFCFRVRRSGGLLGVARDSRVWHKESATAGRDRVFLDLTFGASAALFFRKHAPLPAYSISVGGGLRIAKRLLSGNWRRAQAVGRALASG